MEGECQEIFLDKTGCTFSVGHCTWGDYNCLVKMYDLFEPKQALQGLPPENPELRQKWIKFLLENNENFLIWEGDEVVGHSALLPDMKRKDAEYIIFIRTAYRNRGLGTVLTETAIKRARELGIEVIWLSVDSHNLRAIGLYKKCNFKFHGTDNWERTMILRL